MSFDLPCAGTVNRRYFNFQQYSTINGYVDDLLRILDASQIMNCIYIGHSLSGSIGLLASIRRPDLFSKIIPIGFSPRHLNDLTNNYHGGFD
ncbi:alpha/beta-Hydrolases superfamily protein [Perilla frutescens var. frutescens]|nr:alpha/beta-Hydrolases superfamily protein [Perilla frutescens var. frutescens]